MKRIIMLLCMVSFVLVCFHQAEAKRVMELRIGKGEAKVSFLEGSAQVLPMGTKKWRSLRVGDILTAGDEVNTGAKAKMELYLPDASTVRFADKVHFKVLQIASDDGAASRNIKFHMAVGKAWANVSKAVGKKGQFALQCENAVAGVRGTIYRVNVEDDKSALVRVYDGTVHVTGGGIPTEVPKMLGPPKKVAGPKQIAGPKKVTMEEWVFIIKSMQQIRIAADGSAEKPRDFTEQEDRDEWVDWNKARDKELLSE